MARFAVFALVLAASTISVSAFPLDKRIAQVITESTAQWEQACLKAGGAQQCNPLSITSFDTLLANAGDCDQQNAADKQIDLAKTLGNDPNMIRLTQIFAQQPRNSPNSVSIPYCQTAPRNAELNGLFQCQFSGVNPTTFVGGLKVGDPGTIPFGQTSPVSPPGSCPANPSGGIADGTQLIAVTQNPGVGSGGNTRSAAKATTPAASATTPANPASTSPAAGGDFHRQNGLDAQKLNASFSSLSAGSPCTDGQSACVGGGFAQCVGGTFAITQCAGGTTCVALPLVNKPGTSITCDTTADALARMAASGVSGGLTG
jgi:hypothetical protein